MVISEYGVPRPKMGGGSPGSDLGGWTMRAGSARVPFKSPVLGRLTR